MSPQLETAMQLLKLAERYLAEGEAAKAAHALAQAQAIVTEVAKRQTLSRRARHRADAGDATKAQETLTSCGFGSGGVSLPPVMTRRISSSVTPLASSRLIPG